MAENRFIGIDVGGTKVLGLSHNATDGSSSDTVRLPTIYDTDELIKAIISVTQQLLERNGPAKAVGIGLPGLVDTKNILRYGPNVPGIENLDIATMIADRFDLPCVVKNDATMAAIAEHQLGAAKGYNHAIIVNQGTGIGGAIISNGALLEGANGFAGEPGHMLIAPNDSFVCACGITGCWEAVASGAGLANIAKQHAKKGSATRILALAGDLESIRGEHVSLALAEGDAQAKSILDEFTLWVARGLGGLISLLDPQIIVLGGGLSAINQEFIPVLEAEINRWLMGSTHRPAVPVLAAAFGEQAGALGSAIAASQIEATLDQLA